MLIANPIYDVVFKRMMEHDRIAKFFIGAILEKTVESIVARPQEFTYMAPGSKVVFYRFIATIKTEFGELHHAGVEPAQREELEKEQEAWRSIYAIFGTEVKGLRTGMKEKEKLIEELKLEKDEKERALGEKEKALGEKEKTIEELKLEKDEKDKIIEELKRKLGEK